MSAMILLQGVEKRFGAVVALDSVSLEIQPGEFFSLLGPSGCGKTTLLRAIAGFETPDSGSLSIDGASMEGVPPNRRPTNMVFQSYAIFPHMTVGENVGYGMRARGMPRDEMAREVSAALELVGLGGLEGRESGALSGGQRQRVALARALALKPKVLLLDEPLSALDRKLREQMQEELRTLQRQVGITFVLVTHDQEEALIMSDRVAVMFDGGIEQLASPDELYCEPANRRVAEFIGAMNFLECAVSEEGDFFSLDIEGLGKARVARSQARGAKPGLGPAVGIRPEMLTILKEGSTRGGRVCSGVIEEVTYYGDMTYYHVRPEGSAHAVSVSMRNFAGRPVMSRGETARVGWEESGLILFR